MTEMTEITDYYFKEPPLGHFSLYGKMTELPSLMMAGGINFSFTNYRK